MAYDAHVNYADCFGMVKLWDVIIYNDLRKKNIVLSAIEHSNKKDQFAGAYVKEPVPGPYDWVVSLDLNSLYPSLIRFLNISPETLIGRKHPNANVEKMINKEADLSYPEDYCVAANGAMYSKEKVGFMPALVTRIYDERVTYKKTMLQKKQELVNIKEEIKRRGLK
jgi:DNA polymerase elongation subunit (family B)